MNLSAQISVGEFLDKNTILAIKFERIKDETKPTKIHNELEILPNTWQASPFSQQEISIEIVELKSINDQRATVKRNIKVGSELVEEKSYQDYTQKS